MIPSIYSLNALNTARYNPSKNIHLPARLNAIPPKTEVEYERVEQLCFKFKWSKSSQVKTRLKRLKTRFFLSFFLLPQSPVFLRLSYPGKNDGRPFRKKVSFHQIFYIVLFHPSSTILFVQSFSRNESSLGFSSAARLSCLRFRQKARAQRFRWASYGLPYLNHG